MKNIEIKNLYECLTRLKDKKLPIGVSFALARNVKALRDVAEDIEESRIKIIEQYANKDDSGKLIINNDMYDISPENINNCNNDINSLWDYEVDIHLEKISMSDIEKCDLDKYDSLTFSEFEILEPLIKYETDDEAAV